MLSADEGHGEEKVCGFGTHLEHSLPTRGLNFRSSKVLFTVKEDDFSIPYTRKVGFENLRTSSYSRLTSHPGTSVLDLKFVKATSVSLLPLCSEGKVTPTVMRVSTSWMWTHPRGLLVSIWPQDTVPVC